MNFFGKLFKTSILFIFFIELLSFFGYLQPDFNEIAFFVILILALILTLKKLEYGIWILLAELFIGSKGYLFFFDFEGIVISIRIALWLIIMSVWLSKVIINLLKTKKFEVAFLKSNNFPYFFILFIFILWGLVNGMLGNNFGNVFFDFNGWIYFLLIFPIYEIFKNKELIQDFFQIFLASITWVSIKTFILLFMFSHNIYGIIYELYRWTRVSGVGEITLIEGGFYRIFFQSHIFVLIGFFIFLVYLFKEYDNKFSINLKNKNFLIHSGFVVLFLSVIILSFSRSFWVGLAIGFASFYLYLIIKKESWKKLFKLSATLILYTIISFIIIVCIVKFPYPTPAGGFSTGSLLASRISDLSGGAAVSSRWALLPELWSEIKDSPILGKGFGTTVTYITSDPRVLESSPTGEYTTYAFEWGWLDIWLKLGLIGLFSYLILIGKLVFDGYKQRDNKLILGLILGLIVVSVVSIFSPYLNHPLGIGYLILASVILEKKEGPS